MSLFRAIMTLTASLEKQVKRLERIANFESNGNDKLQEPIIDPVNMGFDIKRKIANGTNTLSGQLKCSYDVHGSLDLVSVNVAQKDLMCIFSTWEDNISKLFPTHDDFEYEMHSLKNSCRNNRSHEAVVRKLEVFFSQEEQPVCEMSTKLTMDGLQLNLFLDTDEVSLLEFYSYKKLKISEHFVGNRFSLIMSLLLFVIKTQDAKWKLENFHPRF